MYDSPKAAHFDAYHDGVKLAWNDPAGLAARWQAASVVAKRLTSGNVAANMLRMDAAKSAAIKTVLAELNASSEITVNLATPESVAAGIGPKCQQR